MRVLAVASYGTLGGAELALVEFLEHRPADVEPHSLLVEDGPLRARLAERGVPVWTAAGYEGRPGPADMGRFSRSLAPLLRELGPDVVWAVGLKAATLAAPACRLTRTPLMWHKVDFSLDGRVTKPLGLAVNGVVSVSEAAAEALGPLKGRRLVDVVGPPVPLPRDLRVVPQESPPAIGTLGRLIPIKGQHHIIRAAALLCEEFPDLQVVLAGEGSPAYPDHPAALRELARETGLRDRVEFAGFVDPASALARLTVFVNATYRDEQGYGWEGLSGAMLEASWAGLPVVATRAGGTAEGVRDGITGTLVDEADPAQLAAAIGPYLRDHELARRIGAAGAAFARGHFAPEVVAARLFSALARLAEGRGAA
ncbi:MAG: glycosyltransferase family 4 protein [Solirubrobacteraceae bacterium]